MQKPRFAENSEIRAIADVLWQCWHDVHAEIAPSELVELRTKAHFLSLVPADLKKTRVIGSVGKPVGMCSVRGKEVAHLNVSESARGTGVALSLLQDAEDILRNTGVKAAWLDCAVSNTRAVRFYEKCGWNKVGKMRQDFETKNGTVKLETWRFEKEL